MTITVQDGDRIIEFPDEETANRYFAQQNQPDQRGQLVGTFAGGEGAIYRRPDGSMQAVSPGVATTDQEVIGRIMDGGSYQEAVQSQADRDRLEGRVLPRVNEFIRGIPFVGSRFDEALGLVDEEGAEEMRRDTAAMQRENPIETGALNFGGGLATAAAAAPSAASSVPQWFSNLPRWQRAIITAFGGGAAGGVEGAIYGSGEGETPEERRRNAEQQGLLGALFGTGVGLAAPVAADLFDTAVKAIKRSDVGQIASRFGLSRSAARVLKQHLDADDLEGARAVLERGGDEAMLGEATRGSRSLLDATAARGGQAENVVRNAIEGRVSGANQQFRQAADDVLGPAPTGLRSATEEISARTAPARSAAYDAAYRTPIDYSGAAGRNIEDVFDRVPNRVLIRAVRRANDRMQMSGNRNMQIMADIADDGSVTFREMPNVQQLDEIKKALNDIARDGTDATTGKMSSEALDASRLASELRDATIEATGGREGTYARAVSIGGDKVAEDQALKMGSDILSNRVTREDVIRQMRGASNDAKNAARIGLRQEIDEIMSRTRAVASDPNVEARQVYDIIKPLSSESARTKIRAILGNDEANRLFREIDRLTSGFELRAAVSENSRTARRASVGRTIDEATARGPISSAAAGEPLEAGRAVVRLLTGETPDALAFRQEGVAEEIARFLTTQRGRSAEAALNYVNKVMDGQRLTDSQAKFVANYLTNAGFLAAVPQASRALQPQ